MGKTESQSLGFLPFQIAGRCALSARAALGRLITVRRESFCNRAESEPYSDRGEK